MSRAQHSSERIVVIGGGFAGLSAAVRLAQAGLPVTVMEQSQLGFAASTRNQGWLHSGAWFAPRHPELARLCYESLMLTLGFSPECVEPRYASMIYLNREEQEPDAWTSVWDRVGIPYQVLDGEQLANALPTLNLQQVRSGFRLPDRAFRPDFLLSQLAAAARQAGAEIRASTIARSLVVEDSRVTGVTVGADEELQARFLIVAAGVYAPQLFSRLFASGPGCQSSDGLVRLKTHLRAVQPETGCDPFCVMDNVGFNHLPHFGRSVFGTDRWHVVSSTMDEHTEQAEIEAIERQIGLYFPKGFSADAKIIDWSGITLQAMHADQIHPGEAPLPTIVDHSQEPCRLENVISIFPGRATLWPQLAEQVRNLVLEKIGSRSSDTSQPLWALRS
jgi:glycine/D-amino acid oxidase-like deaminating enzyme